MGYGDLVKDENIKNAADALYQRLTTEYVSSYADDMYDFLIEKCNIQPDDVYLVKSIANEKMKEDQVKLKKMDEWWHRSFLKFKSDQLVEEVRSRKINTTTGIQQWVHKEINDEKIIEDYVLNKAISMLSDEELSVLKQRDRYEAGQKRERESRTLQDVASELAEKIRGNPAECTKEQLVNWGMKYSKYNPHTLRYQALPLALQLLDVEIKQRWADAEMRRDVEEKVKRGIRREQLKNDARKKYRAQGRSDTQSFGLIDHSPRKNAGAAAEDINPPSKDSKPNE